MLFLETQHVTFTCAARSTEDEVYALWALGAGILNLVLTYFLGKRYGLLGIASGTMIAQMMTNNWYCVYHGLERLQLKFAIYATRILAPLVALALATALPLVLVTPHLPTLDYPWSDWLRLAVVCGWTGLVLLTFFWLAAINADERSRLIAKAKTAIAH
jgi:hypothetical protein